MINNLITPNIRIFVFGTLRVGERLDYYMEGASPLGLYYTRGQLMEATIGSAYIDFNKKEMSTIGELYHVNYYCLLRINHLESTSGEFPKGYDLSYLPVWPVNKGEESSFSEEKMTLALYYRRRNEPKQIISGDWTKRKAPIEKIGKYLAEETENKIYHKDIIDYLVNYLNEK